MEEAPQTFNTLEASDTPEAVEFTVPPEDIESEQEVHSEEIEKNDECNYYMITQSIIGKPNNMGGTFKVKKIDNFYYVTSYDNMPR